MIRYEMERFQEILSRYPQGASPKTQELGELYGRFQKELEKRRLLDRYDREREIIRHLENGISLPFLEGIQEIRILDIYNPTLLLFSLLKIMVRIMLSHQLGMFRPFSSIHGSFRSSLTKIYSRTSS